jgi:hypothetical protein
MGAIHYERLSVRRSQGREMASSKDSPDTQEEKKKALKCLDKAILHFSQTSRVGHLSMTSRSTLNFQRYSILFLGYHSYDIRSRRAHSSAFISGNAIAIYTYAAAARWKTAALESNDPSFPGKIAPQQPPFFPSPHSIGVVKEES